MRLIVDIKIDDCWSEYITGTNGFSNHETRQETVSPRVHCEVLADEKTSELERTNNRR